ncbi:hypothetical protein CLV30_11777 [Haloactinopolyspora alba]|uniref:Uncharacterized protein n=1 Tax=Haloactinopolyspora alba TaxID=648780 RepID=A0A2P8DRG4_9ACTN|nr:hypothetical protein CLV30_11777 [Haloactinopolyspora alba]
MGTRDTEQILAEETEASEAGRDTEATYVQNRSRGKDPSLVYSVRMPVHRLEELRVLAEQNDMTPSALMRRFALEGLDRAADATPRVPETRDDVGLDGEQMVVMTPDQFKAVVHDAIQMTAQEVLSPLMELVQQMQEKQRHSAA